jgi:uncharacterized protein YndB with AHSA1/START domain
VSTTRTSSPTETTTAVYKVYIKATPEAVWTAITDPEWTNRYGYTGHAHYDLRPGGRYEVVPNDEFRAGVEAQGHPCPDVVVDGEVVEVDEPHRLVTRWKMLMDPTTAAEPYTTITYEIADHGGFCSLTLTHDLTGAPATARLVTGDMDAAGEGGGGGHAWVLSDLKSLLETGSVLAG